MFELYVFYCLAVGGNCLATDTNRPFDSYKLCQQAGKASLGTPLAQRPEYSVKSWNCVPARSNDHPMYGPDDDAPLFQPEDSVKQWR